MRFKSIKELQRVSHRLQKVWQVIKPWWVWRQPFLVYKEA